MDDTQAGADHVMLSIIAASVGLDPTKDINWVGLGSGAPRELFKDDKIDAFLTYPPWAQELAPKSMAKSMCPLATLSTGISVSLTGT